MPLLDSTGRVRTLGGRTRASRPRTRTRLRRPAALLPALVLLLQPFAWYSVLPYPLAYYDTLLGGAVAAQRMILVGWGEGLDQAANYVNAQPGRVHSHGRRVLPADGQLPGALARHRRVFRSHRDAHVRGEYINARQRGQVPSQLIGRAPEYVVQINGIDYARVYRW